MTRSKSSSVPTETTETTNLTVPLEIVSLIYTSLCQSIAADRLDIDEKKKAKELCRYLELRYPVLLAADPRVKG